MIPTPIPTCYLLAGGERDGVLHQVVVVPAQAALQRHLGVRVEVGVSDARARDPRHVASLGLAGQVGLLLHRHEVHVARGVEPGAEHKLTSSLCGN